MSRGIYRHEEQAQYRGIVKNKRAMIGMYYGGVMGKCTPNIHKDYIPINMHNVHAQNTGNVHREYIPINILSDNAIQ